MERRHALVRAIGALTLAGAAAAALGACGEDDRPASWSYIHASIIAPNCATASCHTKENAQAGVQLYSAEAAYTILVGRACDGNDAPGAAPRNYVSPFQPERSQLVYLLLGDDSLGQMPPDRPLPDRDIDLITRWIEEGAPCN
ncbi:MAG TPA: hypothetical protein VKB80_34300 [Kofleriaceae bacterium]|nr:hypothetical protein [Kofleriaceae bacterium]